MRIESENISEYYNSQSKGDRREIASLKKEEVKVKSNKEIRSISNKIDKKAQEHELIEAIEKANKHFNTYDRKLEFSIHEKTKQILVKVINTDDNTVIREIPSEKILDMVAKIWEMAGIFVDEKR